MAKNAHNHSTTDPLYFNKLYSNIFIHLFILLSVKFSPNGSKIVTLWGNNHVSVWNVTTGAQISSFDAPGNFSHVKVEFLDESKLIYYQLERECNGDTPSIAHIIDFANFDTLTSFEFFMDLYMTTVVRNNLIAISTDHQIKVWDSVTQQVLYEKIIDGRYAWNGAIVLTDRAMWVSEVGGVVSMVDAKEWREIGKSVVVDGQIDNMFGMDNKLVIACKSGDVFFAQVLNF